ncbi:MAG TPA: hypothetical protein VFB93_08495 [Burkholderiales bacterium]|nr:hypothetical protein [Burkholderiales bacterium]
MWAHGRALLVQMFAVTFITGASSSVPMRTDVVSGVRSRGLKRGEPQSPQKKRCSVRPLSAVTEKRLDVPCVMRKAELGTIAFTLPAVPEAFWQSLQWQARSSVIGTLTS